MTELGNFLRQKRIEKNLSIEDVQHATRIQKRYLQNIEEGNYNNMPGNFYVRAFVKQYAETLGLNSEEILREFNADLPSAEIDEETMVLSRVKSNAVPSNNKWVQFIPKIILGLFVIMAGLIIYYFVTKIIDNSAENDPNDINGNTEVILGQKKDDKTDDDKEEKTNEEKQAEQPKTEEQPQPTVPQLAITPIGTAGKTTTYEVKNAATYKLKIVSTGEAWIGAKNSAGKNFPELGSGITLKSSDPAKEIDVTNEAQVELNLGRPTETQLFINDVLVNYAIQPTEQSTQIIIFKLIK